MFSKNAMLIIEFLLRNLDEYNVNQLARKLKISVGSAHKILKDLQKRDLAIFRERGNATFYKLNLENRETQKISEIALIESRKRKLSSNPLIRVYTEDLEKFGYAKALILFGSILKKKEFGDIDVLFVIEKKGDVKKVNEFCLELSKTSSKPIVPLIMTERDLIKNLKKGYKVLFEILREGVVLSGEDVLIRSLKELS